jgi:hypothetical protein
MSAAVPSQGAHDPPHGSPKADCVQYSSALRWSGEALPAQWASLGEVAQ